MSPPESKLHPLHRAWRSLPARPRRALFGRVTALLAPHIARTPPPARHGLGVGGELATPTGLGSSARRMRLALDQLGVANWGLDTGDRLPGHHPDRVVDRLPDAAPLVLHVNAPMMAWGLLRLPRPAAHGRRIIGYWAW